MKALPKVQKYMTTTPQAIHAKATLREAIDLMEKNHIRHLPVSKSATSFGILSDRDIKKLLSFAGTNVNLTLVGDVCEDVPFVVKPESTLPEVAERMAREKLGSALVVDNGKLVGIFTSTDACQALSDICQERFHA